MVAVADAVERRSSYGSFCCHLDGQATHKENVRPAERGKAERLLRTVLGRIRDRPLMRSSFWRLALHGRGHDPVVSVGLPGAGEPAAVVVVVVKNLTM